MVTEITDDFDLAKIAESGQCFRWEGQEDGSFRILNGAFCLYATALGDSRYLFECGEAEYESVWKDYFDLRENYGDIRKGIDREADPFLWAASEHGKGIRILRQKPWEALASFIISQNKNIPAIRRSIELLAKQCGERKADGRGKVYYAFPEAKAVASLSESALKECGLGYRWKYVKAAAEAVTSGRLDFGELEKMEDCEAEAELMKLHGVGAKVASCVSLYGLHRLDAFPRDVWIKRILENEYPDGYPYGQYQPYNGVYQQYMFFYYRNREGD